MPIFIIIKTWVQMYMYMQNAVKKISVDQGICKTLAWEDM